MHKTFIAVTATIIFFSCSAVKPIINDTIHPSAQQLAIFEARINRQVPFTSTQQTQLQKAVGLANTVLQDPLFERLIISASAHFPWDNRRLDKVNQDQRHNPVLFFLNQYRVRGLPDVQHFVGRNDYEKKTVTASTKPCSETINFNVNNLDQRQIYFIAGTIVHERMHSFCFQHRSNNINKIYNSCDMAYHMGHIAIALSLYRANRSTAVKPPKVKMCKSLRALLHAEGIYK